MTQCERIILYIKEYGSITQLEALREFGCMRLASRVSDMRKQGIDIIAEKETALNRYGEKVNYARYRLGADNE